MSQTYHIYFWIGANRADPSWSHAAPRAHAFVNASCAPAMRPLMLSVFPRLVNLVSFVSNSIGGQGENKPED